jgi:hypothetical protein
MDPACENARGQKSPRKGRRILVTRSMILFICLATAAPPCGARAAPSGSPGARRAKAARTFVELSPAELAREIDDLKHLQAAESQDLLPEILDRAGRAVAKFFSDFPNTTCNEVVSSKIDMPDYPSDLLPRAYARFNYIALAEPGGDGTVLQEYRGDSKGNPVRMAATLPFITSGFMGVVVHFHPKYQVDSRFRYVGREPLNRRDAYVVSFAQRPDHARRFVTFVRKKEKEIVFLQGVAWIDPVSYGIMRMRTDILKVTGAFDLPWLTTQVDYSEVPFEKSGKTLLLPQRVRVDGQMAQYTFHNEHRYSDYLLFEVHAKSEPKSN